MTADSIIDLDSIAKNDRVFSYRTIFVIVSAAYLLALALLILNMLNNTKIGLSIGFIPLLSLAYYMSYIIISRGQETFLELVGNNILLFPYSSYSIYSIRKRISINNISSIKIINNTILILTYQRDSGKTKILYYYVKDFNVPIEEIKEYFPKEVPITHENINVNLSDFLSQKKYVSKLKNQNITAHRY